MLGLLSENLGKYELLTGADVLIKRDLFKKAAAVKGFEYSPLGSELKKKKKFQINTDLAKEQYQGLDNVYGFNKTVVNKKRDYSDLMYNSFSFNISDYYYYDNY